MFRALRIEYPFGAQMAIERVASIPGWESVGKLDGYIRAFSELSDMRFQARLPLRSAYESAP
jgi:hypothetical protein